MIVFIVDGQWEKEKANLFVIIVRKGSHQNHFLKSRKEHVMIIALVVLWLLLDLLGAIIIKEHDGTIPLFAAIIFVACGAVTLLVVFGYWLWDTDI